MILHTLNASPTSAAFGDCLNVLQAGDAMILMGDGVYAAIPASTACTNLLDSGVELYLLTAHALAAGITESLESVTMIDMQGFVALTERFQRQQAWY
jgi:tRNA 2-thiouridine synthesizing protein B